MLYRRPARRPMTTRPTRRPKEPSDGSRRSWGWVLAAVVALGGLAAGLVVALGGRAARPPGRPSAFEVVYQVTTAPTGPAQTRWEVLSAHGPFDVSDLTYNADPRTGARPVSGTVTTFDGLYNLGGGDLTLASDRVPALGSGDQALEPELPDLLARRLAVRTGSTRRLDGLSCQVFRLSEPPAGPLTPAVGANHDDLCLSSAGLELAESWTYGGRVVLQRIAVEVTLSGSDRRISGAPPPQAGRPAVTVLRVGPPQLPTFLAAPPAPAGFRALSPLGVVSYDPSQTNRLIAGATVWAFQWGGQVVTVEAGQGQVPWDDTGSPTASIRLAGLGVAHSVLRSDGPEIQAQLPDNRWVRVDGTVPLSYLAAYANRLGPA